MACHLLIDSKMCDGEQDDDKEYQEWEGEQQEVRERENQDSRKVTKMIIL